MQKAHHSFDHLVKQATSVKGPEIYSSPFNQFSISCFPSKLANILDPQTIQSNY